MKRRCPDLQRHVGFQSLQTSQVITRLEKLSASRLTFLMMCSVKTELLLFVIAKILLMKFDKLCKITSTELKILMHENLTLCFCSDYKYTLPNRFTMHCKNNTLYSDNVWRIIYFLS